MIGGVDDRLHVAIGVVGILCGVSLGIHGASEITVVVVIVETHVAHGIRDGGNLIEWVVGVLCFVIQHIHCAQQIPVRIVGVGGCP